MENMGSFYTFIGVVLSSYGLMQMFVRLPLGVLSDYIKVRRPFIIAGFLTSIVSSLGFVITNQLEWALGFRAIAGITAATWVAFTVLYTEYFPEKETMWAMGTLQFVTI
jgi:DHA1 family multidrug resistance protein-like MFS transporter